MWWLLTLRSSSCGDSKTDWEITQTSYIPVNEQKGTGQPTFHCWLDFCSAKKLPIRWLIVVEQQMECKAVYFSGKQRSFRDLGAATGRQYVRIGRTLALQSVWKEAAPPNFPACAQRVPTICLALDADTWALRSKLSFLSRMTPTYLSYEMVGIGSLLMVNAVDNTGRLGANE